jgi:hypothetical protein
MSGLGQFVGIQFYDGQGFLAHKSFGAKSLSEVGAATLRL